jgi:hypothetical protein
MKRNNTVAITHVAAGRPCRPIARFAVVQGLPASPAASSRRSAGYRQSLTGVSAAAGALQRAGLIRYSRGIVTSLDRHGLRARACECYGLSRREFDRLLGRPPRRTAAPRQQRSGHA